MRFLTEWLELSGLDFDTVLGGWRYTVCSAGTVMIEGHKGIVRLSVESVVVRTGGAPLEVKGKNLRVDFLADGVLTVKGESLSVAPMVEL